MTPVAWEMEAYHLASLIEWLHAKDKAAIHVPGQHRMKRKERAAMLYDPHAATELGTLIIARLGPKASQPPPADMREAEGEPQPNPPAGDR